MAETRRGRNCGQRAPARARSADSPAGLARSLAETLIWLTHCLVRETQPLPERSTQVPTAGLSPSVRSALRSSSPRSDWFVGNRCRPLAGAVPAADTRGGAWPRPRKLLPGPAWVLFVSPRSGEGIRPRDPPVAPAKGNRLGRAAAQSVTLCISCSGRSAGPRHAPSCGRSRPPANAGSIRFQESLGFSATETVTDYNGPARPAVLFSRSLGPAVVPAGGVGRVGERVPDTGGLAAMTTTWRWLVVAGADGVMSGSPVLGGVQRRLAGSPGRLNRGYIA